VAETHTVYSVFTPTTQAKVNFVPRKAVNDQLVDALRTPGKQLVVYGESGSGKSTLLQRKLDESHITTRYSSTTTFEQLLLDALDQLNAYFVENASTIRTKGVSAGLVADFTRIRASIDSSRSQGRTQTTKRIIPPQLTPQRLGQFMGAQELCWVIEDFHKVPEEQKRPLAQSLKIFSDLAGEFSLVKIIAIGATDTAREVVRYEREMAHRVFPSFSSL
jgi:GTPase SAR1 family protein